MSSNDPIFSREDVVNRSTLPPELAGKTPEEISAYYQRREQLLTERLRATPAPAPAREEPVDDKIDLFNDPTGSINRVVERKVNEQMGRMASVAVPGIVSGCRLAMRDAHADYPRFGAEVEKRMALMSSDAQMNPQYWEMTYKVVKGEMADTMVAEATTAERNKRENPVESTTAKGSEPPKPRELSDEEKDIARKLGIGKDKYIKAADRYSADDGRLPMTTDSKVPRQRKQA